MADQVEDREDLEVLLRDEERFDPPEEFKKQANFSDPAIYEEADKDFEGWWAGWARELDWFEDFDEVLDWSNPPFAKWFADGKLNASHNCLDRHVDDGKGDKVAYHWVGEDDERKDVTYAELLDDDQEVRQRAEEARRREGRRRRHLHADAPGDARRDAGLRADRRDPQRGLRRLLGQQRQGAHGGLRREGADHRRLDPAPRQADRR